MPKITRQHLTDTVVDNATCPTGKAEAFYWDSEVEGLGLRVYSAGARAWIFKYRTADGQQRRPTLKAKTLKDARKEARNLSAQVTLGGDPQAQVRALRRSRTIRELIDAYLDRPGGRERSRAEERRALLVHAKPVHYLKACTIDRADLANLFIGISKKAPTTANRVRSYMSALFTWGMKSGLIDIDANPVARTIVPHVEASRDRVLTSEELAAIWACTAGEGDYHRIVRLLMITGQRRDEVGDMRWSEIAGDIWTIPASRTKNGLPHEVPLTAFAIKQLPPRREERDRVFGLKDGPFSGWSKSKARLDVAIGRHLAGQAASMASAASESGAPAMPAWRLHDLRRTFATQSHEHGAEPHIVEAVLNHASGAARSGVAGVYNRAAYRQQKRATLEHWCDFLLKVSSR